MVVPGAGADPYDGAAFVSTAPGATDGTAETAAIKEAMKKAVICMMISNKIQIYLMNEEGGTVRLALYVPLKLPCDTFEIQG